MKAYKFRIFLSLVFAVMVIPQNLILAQQTISIGLHADPVISWFASDIKEMKNNGAKPGFNFGINFNKFFTQNYSFSTGISLLNAGGTLINSDTLNLQFTNFNSTVLPGKPVVYKIQYIVIPVGLKLQTNQIGYMTFFSDIGLDPKVVIGGKADIPSLSISDEKATDLLRMFNLSYHITAGIEYSLGGTTALVLGLNFDNNFLDITKDKGYKHADVVTHKMLSFRLGVNF
jgi:hypothetical protein